MSDCISHGRNGTGYRAKSVLSKHPPKRAKLVAEGRRLPNTGQLTLKIWNRRFGHFVIILFRYVSDLDFHTPNLGEAKGPYRFCPLHPSVHKAFGQLGNSRTAYIICGMYMKHKQTRISFFRPYTSGVMPHFRLWHSM